MSGARISHKDLEAFERVLLTQLADARREHQQVVQRDRPTGNPTDAYYAHDSGLQYGIVIATEVALSELHYRTGGEFGQVAEQPTESKAT